MAIKASNVAGQVVGDLAAAALDEPARIAGKNLAQFLGGLDIPNNAIKFFGTFGSAAKDATLRALTDKALATDITKYKDVNYLSSQPGRIPANNPEGLTEVYFRNKPRGVSKQQSNAGRYEADVMSPAGASIYGATGLGPESVGNIAAGAGTALALGLAGWGFGQLMGGSKPRSDYALAVQGNPYLGSNVNPNIAAAQASAYYQQQTAQMKFEHQMQLQQARLNAQTPTNQPYGGVSGSIPGIDTDLAAVGRSIFGTGLRA